MASPLLSGCAQLDHLVLGDSRDLRHQVVILGAGAAGMAAALELRRRGVPFRIFEASNRWGGRVLTLNDFNSAAQTAEMGAEWIHADHSLVLGLARDLKVNITEVHELLSAQSFWFNGKLISDSDMWRGLREFRRAVLAIYPRGSDEALDQLSLQALVKKIETSGANEKNGYKMEPWIPMWVERMLSLDTGTTSDRVSALPFVSRWLWEAREPLARLQSRRYKVDGGTSVLINALYSRVAGVIQGQFVQLNHELIEMRERLGGLELLFETPDGKVWVQAKYVICTLPFSIVRNIPGLDAIQLSENKLRVIRQLSYGTGAKAAMTYPKRVWRTGPDLIRWAGDLSSQWMWQGDLKNSGAMPVARGIVMAQWAGETGAQAGPYHFDFIKKDLQKMFPKSAESPEEGAQIMNWSMHRWSRGSAAYLAPGQAREFPEFMREPEREGTFLFAGEHVSRDNSGTLQGAMETGMAAAEFLSQLIKIS